MNSGDRRAYTVNVKIILKAVAAAAVSASAVVCLTFGACAGEIESITVLGDSISSGYGLNDGERLSLIHI